MSINKEDFLKVCQEFKLGSLTTESVNIKTRSLSHVVAEDTEAAVRLLQEVDFDALNLLEKRLEVIYQLHADIKKTLANGGRIFLSGCGATGRLSLALETFWRQSGRGSGEEVVGFMAGGDYALIKSVERFEDKMSYGHRQLEELGFGAKDLLLAITEGGETSFVIGSANWARGKSEMKPYFIYCNPDEELAPIKRSRDVIEDAGIEKMNLTVGPMAITGSTRMQATTAQMLAVGLAMFLEAKDRREFMSLARKEINSLRNLSFKLADVIAKESSIYKKGGRVTYVSSPESAITILTDTTERSPTFSLEPFEKIGEPHQSLAFLCLKNTQDAPSAWRNLLGRDPRGLGWADLDIKIDRDEIHKFDISENAVDRRSGENHEVFRLLEKADGFELELDQARGFVPKASAYPVFNQIGLKMALNILSTLIMGKIGRYEGNLMTFVRPSNYKLIDRAARYVLELGKQNQIEFDYTAVVEEIFGQIGGLRPDEPVVLKTLQALKNK